ncbi:unnamed protein product, partial [Mesorhabditis spiculigera]
METVEARAEDTTPPFTTKPDDLDDDQLYGNLTQRAVPSERPPSAIDNADEERPDDADGITEDNGDSAENAKKSKAKDIFGDDDSDDDVQVTIGDVVPLAHRPVPHQPPAAKLDLDHVPSVAGQIIYDLDLAQMAEKPWRNPGANTHDYFNYGFNEVTWNLYCERQKKLNLEFGHNQAAVNRHLMDSIKLPNPQGPIIRTVYTNLVTGRRDSPDNSNRAARTLDKVKLAQTAPQAGFKVNFQFDFSKPPPNFPPIPPVVKPGEAPPGLDSPVTTLAGFTPNKPPPLFDLSVPPPNFSMPPPGFPPIPNMVMPGLPGMAGPFPTMPLINSQMVKRELPPGTEEFDAQDYGKSRRDYQSTRTRRRSRSRSRSRSPKRRRESRDDERKHRRHRSRSTDRDRHDRKERRDRDRKDKDEDRDRKKRRRDEDDGEKKRRDDAITEITE